MRRRLTSAIHSLVLVRFGQELGTDSPAARAIHDMLELLSMIAGSLLR
jgi:hypothetical protein